MSGGTPPAPPACPRCGGMLGGDTRVLRCLPPVGCRVVLTSADGGKTWERRIRNDGLCPCTPWYTCPTHLEDPDAPPPAGYLEQFGGQD